MGTPRLKLAILLAAFVAFVACVLPLVDFAGRACDDAHPCAASFLCVADRCELAGPSDAGAREDAGTPVDAGVADAGDAGSDVDGGGVDGGGVDAGDVVDAGPPVCFGDPPFCAPASAVVTVCVDQVDAGPCASTATAATIGGAIAAAPAAVFVASGTYGENVVVNGAADANVAIIGDAAGAPVVVGSVTVHGNATAFVQGIVFATSAGNVAHVQDTSTATFAGCRFTAANGADNGVGVAADPGTTVTLDRCLVDDNHNGGAQLAGTARVENCAFLFNGFSGPGSHGSNVGGVQLGGAPASVVFRFNTIVGNQTHNAPASVICAQAGVVVSDTISNSNGSDDFSLNCRVIDSIVDGANADVDAGNQVVDPQLDTNDFIHLTPGSPALDAAQDPSPPTHDFDLDARPIGARADVGCDERVQ